MIFMSDPNYESQIAPPPPPPMYPTPAPPLETAPGAIAALVCGIIGVVINCTGVIMGVIALVQRKKAMEHIQAQPGRYGGQGFCTAGLVLGIISIIVGSISVIWLVVWFLILGAFAASAPMMH
jgi:hypothetical protein